MRPAGSPQALPRTRDAAAGRGPRTHEVASMLKMDRRTVRRWRTTWRRDGPEVLRARPSPGRLSKLSDQDKAELERLLLEGA